MQSKPNVLLLADGSRRWSRANNKSVKEGYDQSSFKLTESYETLSKQVSSLYLPICTVNNLTKRPPEQIPWYFDCFINAIKNSSLDINLEIRGDFKPVPKKYITELEILERNNKNSGGLKIVYLVGWSADYEVFNLCKQSVNNPPKDLAELKSRSYINDDIDLIIRTGKAKRLSAMIPIFSPYAEICFIDELFPDLKQEMLEEAMSDFRMRERRFGSG